MKKSISILLACVILMSVMIASGCQVAPAPAEGTETAAPESTAAAAETQDDGAIVATIGDSKITLGDYKKLFEQYAYYYSMFGMDIYSDPSMLAEMRTMVKNALLEKEIVKYQAKLQNAETLTEDQLKAAEQSAENTMTQMREQFAAMAEQAKAEDASIDVEKYISDMISDEAEYNTGKKMTPDEYKQWLKEEAGVEHLRDNLMDAVCKDVDVTQEEIDAWYADALAADKETYASDPSAYKSAQEAFACSDGTDGALPPAYVPEGYSRVMDMLVKPRTDVNEAYPDYAEKVQKQNALQSEYGELAFEDAQAGTAANKARLSEIITEYKALKAETAKMEEEAGAEARAIIEEAYAKLQEGATFESLLIRYTENEAATNCETLMMDGLLMNPDADDGSWCKACIDQFKKLKAGEYSPIFLDDEGYHILYYVGDEKAGDRPLSEIQDAVKALLLEDKKYEEWQTILKEWMQDESVKVYEDVYSTVGA